jgi:hypothetical protein
MVVREAFTPDEGETTMKRLLGMALVTAAVAVTLLGADTAKAYWVGTGWYVAGSSTPFTWLGTRVRVNVSSPVAPAGRTTSNVEAGATQQYAETQCWNGFFYEYAQGLVSGTTSTTTACPGVSTLYRGGAWLWF